MDTTEQRLDAPATDLDWGIDPKTGRNKAALRYEDVYPDVPSMGRVSVKHRDGARFFLILVAQIGGFLSGVLKWTRDNLADLAYVPPVQEKMPYCTGITKEENVHMTLTSGVPQADHSSVHKDVLTAIKRCCPTLPADEEYDGPRRTPADTLSMAVAEVVIWDGRLSNTWHEVEQEDGTSKRVNTGLYKVLVLKGKPTAEQEAIIAFMWKVYARHCFFPPTVNADGKLEWFKPHVTIAYVDVALRNERGQIVIAEDGQVTPDPAKLTRLEAAREFLKDMCVGKQIRMDTARISFQQHGKPAEDIDIAI